MKILTLITKRLMSPAWLVLATALAACTPLSESSSRESQPQGTDADEARTPTSDKATPLTAASLPDLGPAPDFSNEVWLNADQPLSLAGLQGKVVLVEFWTFG